MPISAAFKLLSYRKWPQGNSFLHALLFLLLYFSFLLYIVAAWIYNVVFAKVSLTDGIYQSIQMSKTEVTSQTSKTNLCL